MDRGLATEISNKLQHLLEQDQSNYEKFRGVHVLLDVYLEEVLQNDQIHFTTLFTKLSYLVLKFKLTKKTSFLLHKHRKNIEVAKEDFLPKYAINTAIHGLMRTIAEIEKTEIDHAFLDKYPLEPYKPKKSDPSAQFRDFARIHAFEFLKDDAMLSGVDELFPEEQIKIRLNVVGKNDDYNSLLRFLDRRQQFPITLHLEDIEISEENIYTPSVLIFEPDYLLDITTVSECFKPGESNPLFYFIKKFIPVIQNKYLIVGNVANYFLDELFYNPDANFSTLIKQTFKISPLGFAMMDDQLLKEVVSTLKLHFESIKSVAKNQFSIHGIDTENSYLEPSFYAPKYGFQGRLDLFSVSPLSKQAKIVELKSGKPYRSNSYGLNINHYVQTLLYDLTVHAVYQRKLKVSSFILYSSQASDQLRFAPPLKVQQKEAIKLRNQLVEIDYLLADIELDNDHLFSFIKSNYVKSDGFARRDISKFQKAYEEAMPLVRMYFNAFTAFIAREQILGKTGEYGLDQSSGLAGLWLDEMEEKIENFLVLNAMRIHELKSEKNYTFLTFNRTEATAKNANFRKGDLGILYPFNSGNTSVLRNQVFKCSIIDINQEQVKVRLRNKQQNTAIFIEEEVWHIEHDHLDHGFNSMYQDLFAFLSSNSSYQKKMLGMTAPEKPSKSTAIDEKSYMTAEQSKVLQEMIAAPEYYLLWGPPGTGKTSVMLHEFLKHSYLNTAEKVLVLAYTNRAVDEICEAISNIGQNINNAYFRIGSRYSTNEKFTDDLLVTKLEEIDNRYDLLKLIDQSRIIVSTLASIHGKKELFSLLKFDCVVVDEASQILEPQLIGFLSNARKFILVGDHYQLPAIVRQREDESVIKNEELVKIGVTERRNSLFERLYKICEAKNWYWALGKLTQQGRMYEEIMDFVNAHFYKGMLSRIPSREDLALTPNTQHMHFIPTKIDESSINYKTNQFEAIEVAKIVSQIHKQFAERGESLTEESIGVITPYRAQISAIRRALESRNITQVSVDTVERYQGGARDVIIISLCLNRVGQLKKLVSLSSDGIDRKLNVALTRARQEIYIVGNEEIMKQNEMYANLIRESALFLTN